jgi:hypothetical protein
MTVRFYVGLHHPGTAHNFPSACVSIRTLWRRQKPLGCPDVLVDSGAFTELAMHGRYTSTVAEYAAELRRLDEAGVVKITAAVAQDYMCEPFMQAKTGLTTAEHQRLTIERYDALAAERLPFPIMPVLQGFHPAEYQAHVRAYGARLLPGMWVGVGSVCKRQGNPRAIVDVLTAIRAARPDLVLHGFGVKSTALRDPGVVALLDTADSAAWSFAARKQGRNRHDWREAEAFAARIRTGAARAALEPWQPQLPFLQPGGEN